MSDYLDEAADQLRKARDANEKRGHLAAELADAKLPTVDILREVNARRMEIAAAFTRLAECQAAMLGAARMPGRPPLLPSRAQPEQDAGSTA